MKLWKRKPAPDCRSYDRENKYPVIRSSICTGERTAGFKDKRNGKFEEIMLIRDEKELRQFLTDYGIAPEELKKEW